MQICRCRSVRATSTPPVVTLLWLNDSIHEPSCAVCLACIAAVSTTPASDAVMSIIDGLHCANWPLSFINKVAVQLEPERCRRRCGYKVSLWGASWRVA